MLLHTMLTARIQSSERKINLAFADFSNNAFSSFIETV